jgi:hypothetical protein
MEKVQNSDSYKERSSKGALQLWKLIYIYSDDMNSVLNGHNVAKYSDFYVGYLRFNGNSTGNAGCFKRHLYNGILNVTMWLVLRKRLHLKA